LRANVQDGFKIVKEKKSYLRVSKFQEKGVVENMWENYSS